MGPVPDVAVLASLWGLLVAGLAVLAAYFRKQLSYLVKRVKQGILNKMG